MQLEMGQKNIEDKALILSCVDDDDDDDDDVRDKMGTGL